VQHAAAAKDGAGSESGATGFEKITAGGHGTIPPFFVLHSSRYPFFGMTGGQPAADVLDGYSEAEVLERTGDDSTPTAMRPVACGS
jgi:hypothetical protein